MDIQEFNDLKAEDALRMLRSVCAVSKWAHEVEKHRPYKSTEELIAKSNQVWSCCTEKDYLEAFEAHPMIGDVNSLKEKYAHTSATCEAEQSGAKSATEIEAEELKSAKEMLEILKSRYHDNFSDRAKEIKTAAAEQQKITNLRLKNMIPRNSKL